MPFLFEDLEVYRVSVQCADDVIMLASDFPRGFGFLANQLNRAALSIPANIAEGNGRSTDRDRRHFFHIARGSAQECVPLLEIARRRSLISIESHEHLRSRVEHICRMLSGLIRYTERNERQ